MKMDCRTDSSIEVVSQQIFSMIQMLISEYWLMMFSAALAYLLAVIVSSQDYHCSTEDLDDELAQ
jgi:hypothetical protein